LPLEISLKSADLLPLEFEGCQVLHLKRFYSNRRYWGRCQCTLCL